VNDACRVKSEILLKILNRITVETEHTSYRSTPISNRCLCIVVDRREAQFSHAVHASQFAAKYSADACTSRGGVPGDTPQPYVALKFAECSKFKALNGFEFQHFMPRLKKKFAQKTLGSLYSMPFPGSPEAYTAHAHVLPRMLCTRL